MFEVDHPLIEIISPSEIFILEDNSKFIFIDRYQYSLMGSYNFRFMPIDNYYYSRNNNFWFNYKLINNRGLKIKYKYIQLKDKINLL